MNQETQTTICEWAEEIFGKFDSLWPLLARMHQELGELLVDHGCGKPLCHEAADVMILLYEVAQTQGIDLREAIVQANPDFSAELTTEQATLVAINSHTAILLNEAAGRMDRQWVKGCVVLLGSLLLWLAELAGFNLFDAVNEKMALNRAREWESGGALGMGQHK